MNYNKKQGRFLQRTISEWETAQIITADTARDLQSRVVIRTFDYKLLAKYSFWIAIICGVITFSAVIADEFLVQIIIDFFNASDSALCLVFALFAGGCFYGALSRRKAKPEKKFSNEAIMFVGVLLACVCLFYFSRAMSLNDLYFSQLFLLSTVVFAVLGLLFPSKLVWLFSLISLGSWFGSETTYASGEGAYFLGMNYPLRFVLFGSVLLAASFVVKRFRGLAEIQRPTYIMGLLYTFIALWILSIFGNYGDMSEWAAVKQFNLFFWGILFGGAAVAAIYYGLKYDDSTARSYGITFLFINLYTKYFEYFWNDTHKAVFFFILAVSFWFIGQRAERIWNLEFIGAGKRTVDGVEEES